MTDWRGDLLKIGIIPDDMPDQTNFVLFNLDELNDFIKDVAEKAIDEGVFYGLDKIEEVREEAREEGFIKGVKECTEKLSKLTTK